MTPTEHAYFGLCFAVWQKGIELWMDRVTRTFTALNALSVVETSDARAKRARAAFRIVS